MRLLVLTLWSIILFTSLVTHSSGLNNKGTLQAGSDYECHFQNPQNTHSWLHLNESFDSQKNLDAGKIDMIVDGKTTSSTPTDVYQIVIPNQTNYMQIWYSASSVIRVDAEMTLDGSNQVFAATYNASSEKVSLICNKLPN